MNPNWKKTFMIIYSGQAFSILSSAATQFAIIWWLTVQTESAVTLTTASIIGLIPSLCIGPFSGVLIDRYNRKTVMVWADALVAFSSLLLAGAYLLLNPLPVWFVYLVLFFRGLGSTLHTPALQAAIPALVPETALVKAGGWGNLISSASNMLGPVLGAVLMGFLPLHTIMLVDIVGAAIAIGCLSRIHIPDTPPGGARPHMLTDMRQGLAAMRANKPLMAVFAPMVLCSVIYLPLGALFPLLVRVHYGGEALHNSICEFVFAGGLLVSSFVIGIRGGAKNRFGMISLAIFILGLAGGIGGILPPGWLPGFALCCFIIGGTGTFINVPIMAYTQQTIPGNMLGKVLSFMMAATSAAMPVGLIIAGPVSERIGIGNWFFYSGVALVATGIFCWGVTRKYDKETPQGDA